MSLNPYAAPVDEQIEDRWNQCPVCHSRVLRIRFIFPFQFCRGCGNYLAVRHWTGRTLPWVLGLFSIVVVPVLLNVLGVKLDPRLTPLFMLMFFVCNRIHNMVSGLLVPAVCWGLLALRDDDRLPPDDSLKGGT